MSDAAGRELATFRHQIPALIERIVACSDGLDADALNWRPPAGDANSLHVLAVHTMANAEENVCHAICGDEMARNRDEEFMAAGAAAADVRARWDALRGRIERCLDGLAPDALAEERRHQRRGMMPARELLLITVRHASEHAGQAELTRDLLRGPDVRPTR